VLLVNGGTMPTSVGYELWRLNPRRIVVMGSSGVIPDSLMTQLQAFTTGPVQRLAGADRYATAAAAAMASFAGPVPVAYIATGQNFPDALAGAPAAAAQGGPLLLATATTMPAATVAALQVLKPQRIVVLGGTSVVSASVANQLAGYTTGSVTRLAGADRFATAAAIANAVFAGSRPAVVLATGTNFPDALAGGPIASVNGGPVLLARGACVPASNVAVKTRTGANTVLALGATAVLPDSAVAFTPCV
jgi:putative cell wall-binding protein